MSVVIPRRTRRSRRAPSNQWEANTATAQPFSVFADLRLETDGHRVHLVGDGQSLVVHTSDPRRLLRDVRRMSLPAQAAGLAGRTALGRAADGLRDVGIGVDVRGPDGVLVRLGDGSDSRLGRVITGSSAVQFGKAGDLAAAAGIPGKRSAALVAAGVALVVALLLRRRDGRRG